MSAKYIECYTGLSSMVRFPDQDLLVRFPNILYYRHAYSKMHFFPKSSRDEKYASGLNVSHSQARNFFRLNLMMLRVIRPLRMRTAAGS